MQEMRMSQKPNNPPGHDNGESSRPEYIIDETFTVSREDPVESWDLDYDPQEEETHVIRAIARSSHTTFRVYILPKEELEFIEDDEKVWPEYRSSKTERLKEKTTISHEDEDPYYHDGDYVLALRIYGTNSDNKAKISMKYRRE